MYIAKTGQISKASIYSTLSPIFNIFINVVRGNYSWPIFFHVFAVIVGFGLIQYDKKKVIDKAKRAKVKIKFYTKVNEEYEVAATTTLEIDEDIDDDKLLEEIGKDFN